jgi:hypothetical protein
MLIILGEQGSIGAASMLKYARSSLNHNTCVLGSLYKYKLFLIKH